MSETIELFREGKGYCVMAKKKYDDLLKEQGKADAYKEMKEWKETHRYLISILGLPVALFRKEQRNDAFLKESEFDEFIAKQEDKE